MSSTRIAWCTVGCWASGTARMVLGDAERAGFLSQRTQPLRQKKKKLHKWYKVTGRVLYCGGLSVITTQLLSYVLLSHDHNPCINIRLGYQV